jgi:hypothetical protein
MSNNIPVGTQKDRTSLSASRFPPLEWWYSVSAPSPVSITAPLEQRERIRRGRLMSIGLIVLYFSLVQGFVSGITTHNAHLLVVLGVATTIDIIATILNRRGYIEIAVILVSVVTEAGFIAGTFSFQNGLIGPTTLQSFDTLVRIEIIAGFVLPASSVFVLATLNSIIEGFFLFYLPHDPSFNSYYPNHVFLLIIPVVVLNFMVAVLVYVFARSSSDAIRRANRAEEISKLQHDLSVKNFKEAQAKRQLEHSIQQILYTHVRFANGDLNARVPLTAENVLWPIAGALNNLLVRFQALKRSEQRDQYFRRAANLELQANFELQKMKQHLEQLVTEIRQAKRSGQRIQLAARDSLLAPLIQELNGTSLSVNPPSGPPTPVIKISSGSEGRLKQVPPFQQK